MVVVNKIVYFNLLYSKNSQITICLLLHLTEYTTE